MLLLLSLLGCRTPAHIDLVPVPLVLDRESHSLDALVRDQHGDPIDVPIAWVSSAPELVVDDGSLRCLGRAHAELTATAGSVQATLPVSCHPDARLDPPSPLRLVVGATLPLRVLDDQVVEVPIAARTSEPAVVAVEGGLLRAAGPGTATVHAEAGTLSADLEVRVVASLSRDRIYAVARDADGWDLVAIGPAGTVTPLVALPGYQPGRALLDLRQARIAWIRATASGTAEIAVGEVGAPDARTLGPADPASALGLSGDRFVWLGADGVVTVEEGAEPLPALPERARFTGTDAAGRLCAVTRDKLSHDQSLDRLWCWRGSSWVEQPRTKHGGFGGLVDGGAASRWDGHFERDCPKTSCGTILPIEDLASPWPAGGLDWHPRPGPIAGGRLAWGAEIHGYASPEDPLGLSGAGLPDLYALDRWLPPPYGSEFPRGDVLRWKVPVVLSANGTLLVAGEIDWSSWKSDPSWPRPRIVPGTWSLIEVDDLIARWRSPSRPLSTRRVRGPEDLGPVDWR